MTTRPATLSLALTLALAPSAQDGWRSVSVLPPPGLPFSAIAACRTDDGTTPLRGVDAEREIEARCVAPVLARCHLTGAEPIDIDLALVCRGERVIIRPAVRYVVPSWVVRSTAAVEWLAWDGGVSRLLANRVLEPSAVDPWPVGADTRLLRVHREGASPVTLIVPAAGPSPFDLTLVIPPPAAGGELLLAFGPEERRLPSLQLRGPQSRIVGINDAPFVSVPGLPPGDYELQLGPADAPVGRPLAFSIEAGGTTELVPRLPASAGEVRISGLVTFNGEPMARQLLDVLHIPTDAQWTVTTDDRGRYAITVVEPGPYVVRLSADHEAGHTEVDRLVGRGETMIDLDLVGADLQLTFLQNGALPEERVGFVIEGPVRYTGTATDVLRPTLIRALPYGTYRVYARIPPDLVSTAATIVIDDTPGTRVVAFDLREQRATLRIPDTEGARARADGQILRALPDGAFDVRQLAPGSEVIARAPGRVPACLVLAADADNVMVLADSTATLAVLLDGAARLQAPPGRIRFTDVDRCTVPLEEFEWRRVDGGFELMNVPNGAAFRVEYGAQVYRVTAPGAPLVIK